MVEYVVLHATTNVSVDNLESSSTTQELSHTGNLVDQEEQGFHTIFFQGPWDVWCGHGVETGTQSTSRHSINGRVSNAHTVLRVLV